MNIDKLKQKGFSIGVELPLDNDWTSQGQNKRLKDGRPFGVPDMTQHKALIQLADQLGFAVAWMRDVPLYDPNFGDAAQIFEPFSYLGYLAGITDNILLGTAAIVLPLRQPWLVKKAANTLATLSDNRLILGLASGDRPVEYPTFGLDFNARGDMFREGMEILRDKENSQLSPNLQLFPKNDDYPIYVAGLAQQDPNWIGKNMDGWLAYPGVPSDHQGRVALWRKVAGDKPYVTFIHLDLVADPDAPIIRHRFGIQAGVNGLIKELNEMKAAGVDHVGLQFRRNSRPIEDSMKDIAENVFPVFHRK